MNYMCVDTFTVYICPLQDCYLITPAIAGNKPNLYNIHVKAELPAGIKTLFDAAFIPVMYLNVFLPKTRISTVIWLDVLSCTEKLPLGEGGTALGA